MGSQSSASKSRRVPQTSSQLKTAHFPEHEAPERGLDAPKRIELKRLLEATLSSMCDFAFALDLSGRFLYANLPLLNLWGQTSQAALTKQLADLGLPESVLARLNEQFEEVIASGQKIADAAHYISLAGRARDYEYSFLPVMGTHGNVEFVVGTARDTTVLMQEKRHLVHTEARYRGLIDTAPDGVVVINATGEIVLLNAKCETQFGYRRDELVGKNVTMIIPGGFPSVPAGAEDRLAIDVPNMQTGAGIELSGTRKDGSALALEITLSSLDAPEGMLITAAIRDITLRKADERHLAQMESRYRGLLEAAPDGMIVVNAAGEIVLLNRQAEKQFGYRRDELLGQPIETIIPEGFAERLAADTRRTAAEAKAQQIGSGVELQGRKKDATEFPIEIMLSPLESEEGVLITAAIRDISDRKQLTRQLHQSQKMDAVGQLTGGIAHDFNNLLTVIIGNLALLELEVPKSEATLKKIKTAQKAATRGADVTRRLLVFSRNDGLEAGLVPLGDSIQNMIEMAYRSLGSNIAITTCVDQTIPPVFVDAASFESALLNLLVNARDAMPDGGSIVVSSQRAKLDETDLSVKAGDLKAGDYVCVGVTDTGKGMSQATLERACEPFFTTKARDKGTGLGLAMVYGFAKQSGGAVRIRSQIDNGTTVSFYLPMSAASPLLSQADSQDSLSLKQAGKVLVVDDEPAILEIAVEYLRKMGMDAIQAGDGSSAFKTILQHPDIDLLITNFDMPGELNGAELVKRTLAVRPAMKFIYSSGLRPENQAAKDTPPFGGPMLYKPYQREAFIEIVTRAMEGSSKTPGAAQKPLPGNDANGKPAQTAARKQAVLVIDDEPDVGEFVCATSRAMGFECITTRDAAAFLAALESTTALILLDLKMPGLDGIELLRVLGKQNCKVDIVLMSSVGMSTMESAMQLARGLGLSVAGKLQKPFTQIELGGILARIPKADTAPSIRKSSPFTIQKEELQKAIAEDEFVVYYQPQISIATGRAIGVEALVRWQHPKRGLLYPDRFIERMEELGLIDDLGWTVANRGMIDLVKFKHDHDSNLMLSLNASVTSLCDLKFPDTLVSIADAHGIAPANITIEFREIGLIKEVSKTLDILTRLRMKQINLSIDDFGTGYAMMQQFKLIPATELKIDKSFIHGMMENNRDRIMVQKSIEMGHELGMQVTAEGVESQEQLDFLTSNECDSAQGYFFSHPVSAKDMGAWLMQRRELFPTLVSQ